MSQSRYQFLTEKYVVSKLISDRELLEVIASDPTSIFKDTKLEKVGKYTQWILKQYDKTYVVEDGVILFNRESHVFFEDLYKVKDDLKVFDAIKHRKGVIPQEKKDINNIDDVHELFDLVKPFITLKDEIIFTKAEIKQKVIHNDVDLLYDGFLWDVVTPKTSVAATAISGPPLTRWCTATEGRNAFAGYNSQGSLYVLRDKKKILGKGRAEGQPRPLYQFHFESNTYMDVDDKRVEIADILNGNEELKRFFKPIMMKHYLKTKLVQIKYPVDNISKFISIYGFDDFLNSLPDDITDLDIDCFESKTPICFKLPPTIKRFKKLQTIFLKACVAELPEEMGELKQLQCISFPENKRLKFLPKSLENLPELLTINIQGSSNCRISDTLKQLDIEDKIFISI